MVLREAVPSGDPGCRRRIEAWPCDKMAGLISVRSKTVVAVQLYRWRPTFQRLDVWPFLIAYAVWLCVSPTTLRLPVGEVIAGTVVLACLQILAALFTVWSVDFRCLVAATKVRNQASPGRNCQPLDLCFESPILSSVGQGRVVPRRRFCCPLISFLLTPGNLAAVMRHRRLGGASWLAGNLSAPVGAVVCCIS